MAQDVATLIRDLRYDTWSDVGHDRGPGVAFRLAPDEADQVRALVILDGVPIVEALERADARFAELWWHWCFFASPQAERVITADPLAWYDPDSKTGSAQRGSREPRNEGVQPRRFSSRCG